MDYLTQLLIEYKYWIVVAGALLEGEVVLLFAGAAAYHGYMSLELVMLISFLGAMFHDHLLFFLGRRYGGGILQRFPSIQKKTEKVFRLFEKYQNVLILSFRFVYGLRTATPLIIGTTNIRLKKYSSLTCIAALVWAVVIAYLGYVFAATLEMVADVLQQGQKYLALILICIVLIVWAYIKRRRILSK